MGSRAGRYSPPTRRGVVFVVTVDAVLIGIVLRVLGVPLALPLTPSAGWPRGPDRDRVGALIGYQRERRALREEDATPARHGVTVGNGTT